jgi:hypothetical protein
MVRFQEMCKDGLLGAGDYGIFQDWSDIDRSQDGYIRIKDGLVSGGEIQEMNNKGNFHDKGPYQARVCGFSLSCQQGGCLSLVALIPSNRIGALSQVQGKSGAGNVSCLLVYISCSN